MRGPRYRIIEGGRGEIHMRRDPWHRAGARRGRSDAARLRPEPLALAVGAGTLPPHITVLSDVTEAEIVRTIEAHDKDGRIVIVDLEGIASRLVSRAISQADLVLTPMRATTLDATIGARTIALVAEEEEALGRAIPHAVVFTMTRSIETKQHRGIEQSLRGRAWTW